MSTRTRRTAPRTPQERRARQAGETLGRAVVDAVRAVVRPSSRPLPQLHAADRERIATRIESLAYDTEGARAAIRGGEASSTEVDVWNEAIEAAAAKVRGHHVPFEVAVKQLHATDLRYAAAVRTKDGEVEAIGYQTRDRARAEWEVGAITETLSGLDSQAPQVFLASQVLTDWTEHQDGTA